MSPHDPTPAPTSPKGTVVDNPDDGRFELLVDDEVVSVLHYRRDGELLVIPHVETNPRHRGNDYAATLVYGVMERARSEGLGVRALCGFAARTIDAHPAHRDLLR
jgi:predicted GNAT family acetyltransferase